MLPIYVSGTCSVCLLKFEKADALNCGHVYCHECAIRLKICGLCRVPIDTNNDNLLNIFRKKTTSLVDCLPFLKTRINQPFTKSWSPLMISIKNYDIIVALLKLGVNINEKEPNNDETALIIALRLIPKDTRIILLLLESGANTNDKTKKDYTPLMLALKQQCDKRVVDKILNKENVLFRNCKSWTPIMYYARYNTSIEILKSLIDHGANVNDCCLDGWTPLMLSVRYENANLEMVKILLTRVNVNNRNKNGWTSLMHSIKSKIETEIIMLLLNHRDIDLNIVNNDGWDALMFAIQTKNSIVINKILDTENFILDPQKQCNNGVTYLTLALKYKSDIVVFDKLLKKGANTRVKINDSTLLHKALEYDADDSIIATLLEFGIDLDCFDNDLYSALMIAVKKNRLAIIDLLLSFGANVNSCNENDQNPLTFALPLVGNVEENNNRHVMINKLIDAGARFPLCKKRKIVDVEKNKFLYMAPNGTR
jgi:ankyrin repeat protein